MTKSIFEYKDEQDWYLASFGNYNHLTCFGGDEAYEQFVDFFQALTNVLAVWLSVTYCETFFRPSLGILYFGLLERGNWS